MRGCRVRAERVGGREQEGLVSQCHLEQAPLPHPPCPKHPRSPCGKRLCDPAVVTVSVVSERSGCHTSIGRLISDGSGKPDGLHGPDLPGRIDGRRIRDRGHLPRARPRQGTRSRVRPARECLLELCCQEERVQLVREGGTRRVQLVRGGGGGDICLLAVASHWNGVTGAASTKQPESQELKQGAGECRCTRRSSARSSRARFSRRMSGASRRSGTAAASTSAVSPPRGLAGRAGTRSHSGLATQVDQKGDRRGRCTA